jgi:mannosidase alpha-like ER degradation enhancer 2
MDELKPMSCGGVSFAQGSISMLTLIDSLDTLAIMGNRTEFQRVIKLVVERADFDLDINVSVFETNIRVLGGLLSAHMLAQDPELRLYDNYRGELLPLAFDLGSRLLPAFDTATGIPYGTVNLRRGVPINETKVASVAGGGSLTLEFCVLSALTGNETFGRVAWYAAKKLFQLRSPIGLVGKHVDTGTAGWVEQSSGIGSNADSFFEYLFKMYILFGDNESWKMFRELYGAILRHLKRGDWYSDVDMHSAKPVRFVFDNLQAFWPGVQAMMGELESASATLNAFYIVWREFGFTPEEFDFKEWKLGKHPSKKRYPLRPELIESTMYMYLATAQQDESWLRAGAEMVHSLQRWSRTECGYATTSVGASGDDVGASGAGSTGGGLGQYCTQEDTMPSFFLSETCKYLYLLFDNDNFIHRGNYVFTTEAHPFPAMQWWFTRQALQQQNASSSTGSGGAGLGGSVGQGVGVENGVGTMHGRTVQQLLNEFMQLPERQKGKAQRQRAADEVDEGGEDESVVGAGRGRRDKKCMLVPWWKATHYDTAFIDSIGSEGEEDVDGSCSADGQDGKAQRLEVAGLGTFTVTSHQDGFHVTRDLDGEIIELSNVGGDLAMVHSQVAASPLASIQTRAKPSDGAGTVASGKKSGQTNGKIADPIDRYIFVEKAGRVVDCAVKIRQNGAKAGSAQGGGEHGEHGDWQQVDLGESETSGVGLLGSCSPALFGATVASMGTGATAVDRKRWSGELVMSHPHDHDVCSNGESSHVGMDRDRYRGKIVIAKRGGCMFEEKARTAHHLGATGILVANTAPHQLFVMAGSVVLDEEEQAEGVDEEGADEGSGEGGAVRSRRIPVEPLPIPALMVTQELGEAVAAVVTSVGDTEPSAIWLNAEIELRVVNDDGGARSYPHVSGGKEHIRVLGVGDWGVHVQHVNKGEWQLFVVHKSDAKAQDKAQEKAKENAAAQEIKDTGEERDEL